MYLRHNRSFSFVLAQEITSSTNDATETFNFRLGTSFLMKYLVKFFVVTFFY